MAPLISCENISKTYLPDVIALTNISFKIDSGEFIILAGPNGAGKTTLLKLLYGELEPTTGTLRVNVPLGRIGVMPQEITLFEELTTWEHTYYLSLLKGIEKTKCKIYAENVLRNLGLWSKKDTIVKKLSGGQKRLLCASQALVGENYFLMLDEPTIQVDVENRLAMYNMLEELKKTGVSILYTTHFLDEIGQRVDRLILLNHGQILYDGLPDNILDDLYHSKIEIPKTEATLGLIKNMGLTE